MSKGDYEKYMSLRKSPLDKWHIYLRRYGPVISIPTNFYYFFSISLSVSWYESLFNNTLKCGHLVKKNKNQNWSVFRRGMTVCIYLNVVTHIMTSSVSGCGAAQPKPFFTSHPTCQNVSWTQNCHNIISHWKFIIDPSDPILLKAQSQ